MIVRDRLLVRYFVLVIVLALPFWAAGYLCSRAGVMLPFGLPVSALMAVCPLVAIVVLQMRSSNIMRVSPGLIWYFVALVAMPLIAALAYIIQRSLGWDVSGGGFSLASVSIVFVLFFIPAFAEEVGWTGFATNRLRMHYTVLQTGIVIGIFWAAWHVVPYVQAGRTVWWVVWQCIFTVTARVGMVWLYERSQRNFWAVVIFHAMINTSYALFPANGSHYNPEVMALITLAALLALLGVRLTKR